MLTWVSFFFRPFFTGIVGHLCGGKSAIQQGGAREDGQVLQLQPSEKQRQPILLVPTVSLGRDGRHLS